MDTIKILNLVRSTRQMSLPYFGNVEVKSYKTEQVVDAVTQIDQDIEFFLKKELSALTPDTTFVGEEFGGDRSKNFGSWILLMGLDILFVAFRIAQPSWL
jgi:fructose-1,6-bisphosphatase/inositol monophosphatase family enzyme